MLKGKSPFEADHEPAVMYAIVNEEPEPVGDNVTGEMRKEISGALEKDPEKRLQTVDQMVIQLNKIHGTVRISGKNPSPILTLLRKQKIVIAASAVIILLVIVALIPYYQLLEREQAKELLPLIEDLVKARKYFEAYQLGMQA